MKFFSYIIFILIIVISTVSCGKKGDLEKPEKSYPREYPSE